METTEVHHQGEKFPMTITRDAAESLMLPEHKPGSWWWMFEHDNDPMKDFTFEVSTRNPVTGDPRGERKIHRRLPSGKEIRIWRRGEAFKYKKLNYKNGDGLPADGHTDEPETSEMRLCVMDAVWLSRQKNVNIKLLRERIDLDKK